MFNILIEELMKRVDSKYRIVMIAAKRAKQINKGAHPLIQTKARKPTTISLEEIAQSVLKYELSPAEEERIKGLAQEEFVKPTWFRDLAPEAALIEESEEEEIEEEELEEEELEEEELEKEEPEFHEEEVIVEDEEVEEMEEEEQLI